MRDGARGGAFDMDCIVVGGRLGRPTRGARSVVVIAGMGGANFYVVDIDGSDAEARVLFPCDGR